MTKATAFRNFGRAAAAIVGLAMLTAPALASERTLDIYYKVYVGGFHVVDLRVDIGLAPENYDVQADVETTGMIGAMFPWWMKAYSNGVFDGDAVRPVAAGQKNNWRGKDRFIDLRFADGRASVERIQPKPAPDVRDRVPEELRAGALDLTSAVIAMITRLERSAECRGRVPVFDGRRRFDLVAQPDGTDTLRPNRYSPFDGSTTTCRMWIDKMAGFRKKDDSGWNDERREARVWVGRAFVDAPPLPVRLTLDTPLGALMAHLNRATLRDGDEQVSLSHADVKRAGVN